MLVTDDLELPVGRLTVFVKSAHLYEPEWALIYGIVRDAGPSLT